MANILSEESLGRQETNNEEKYSANILNNFNKIVKLCLYDDLTLFFDEKMKYVSLCPIIPINKIDLFFQLYNLKITKCEIMACIKKKLGLDNLKNLKIYNQNNIKVQKINDEIKIIDEHFIKDCIFLSNNNNDGAHIITERICKTLFGCSINYTYKVSEETKQKSCIALLKVKENIYEQSDFANTYNEAKLDVNKKIILKYLLENYSNEILNNINEYFKKYQKTKIEKRAKYEKYLEEVEEIENY